MLESILEFVRTIDPVYVYCVLFAGSYVENIFPPFPGDSVIVFGAYMVGTGTWRFDGVLISTTAGSIAGFMTLFLLGKLLSDKWMGSHLQKIQERAEYKKTEKWFDKYGYYLIAGNRFFSGVRSVISLFAGITRLNTKKVFFYALLSCIVWNFALILAGSKLGENWEMVTEIIKKYNIAVIGILVCVVIGYFIRKLIVRKRSNG